MNVLLTKRARRNFTSIKSFLAQEWGDDVAEAFERKTNHFFDLLERFPELGEIEQPIKGIRGFQLTEQTRIFYRIKNQNVIILSFFDVRQNPNKRLS